MDAEVSAAVPAALRSIRPDWPIAFRKRSSSSVMCISQGLFLLASAGSIKRLSGGLEKSGLSTTLYLHLQPGPHYPRGSSHAEHPVGDVALRDHCVLERDDYQLRILGPLSQKGGSSRGVRLVEILVDLVEKVERVRVHLLDRQNQRDRRH